MIKATRLGGASLTSPHLKIKKDQNTIHYDL